MDNRDPILQIPTGELRFLIVGVGVIFAIIILIGINHYSQSKVSNNTTIQQSLPTTILPTTITPTQCATQPVWVQVGNSLICGSYVATITNVSNASVALYVSYNGTYINKVANKSARDKGTFALNFSGATVYARIWSFSVPMQTVYFQMSTAQVVLTTTVTTSIFYTTTVPVINSTISLTTTTTINNTDLNSYPQCSNNICYLNQRIGNFVVLAINSNNTVTGNIWRFFPAAYLYPSRITLKIGDSVGYSCDGTLATLVLTSTSYAVFKTNTTKSSYGCPI
jgi:hypothetical protein